MRFAAAVLVVGFAFAVVTSEPTPPWRRSAVGEVGAMIPARKPSEMERLQRAIGENDASRVRLQDYTGAADSTVALNGVPELLLGGKP